MIHTLLGHASEGATAGRTGFFGSLAHQPTWFGVMVVVAVLGSIYRATRKLGLNFTKRLLVVVATTIVMGVLYMPHNPSVTGIVLSAGFISTFLLTFTMLGRGSNR